jgi:hypothetical protein
VQSGDTWTLPCGGSLTDPDDGTDYDLPSGSTVNDDGSIVVGDGGEATVSTGGGGEVSAGGGSEIIPNGDGNGHTVIRPGGGGATVTLPPDGTEYYVPGDGSVIVIDPTFRGGLRVIGAPAAPAPVMRLVTLKLPAGVVSQPASGMHRIASGKDFVFTLTILSRAAVPQVRTNRLIAGEPEVIDGVPAGDGRYTFTVPDIRQQIEITLLTDVAVDGVAASRIWAHGGKLYVRAVRPATPLYIYTTAGQLYQQQSVDAGETVIALPPGFYIVELDGKRWKIGNHCITE